MSANKSLDDATQELGKTRTKQTQIQQMGKKIIKTIAATHETEVNSPKSQLIQKLFLEDKQD